MQGRGRGGWGTDVGLESGGRGGLDLWSWSAARPRVPDASPENRMCLDTLTGQSGSTSVLSVEHIAVTRTSLHAGNINGGTWQLQW